MNRPLVAVVMAYGSGLLLAQRLGASPMPLTLLVAMAVALFLLITSLAIRDFRRGAAYPVNGWLLLNLHNWPRLNYRPLLVWLLLAVVGWANDTARTTVRVPADLRTLLGNEPAIVTVRGTLVETPRLKIIEQGETEKWHSAARVRVTEINLHDDFQPATGEVLVSTPAVLGPDYFTGQPVEIAGVVARPPPPLAGGMFDFQSYLAARGIYYQLKTESTNDWHLREPQRTVPPLTDRFLNWSRQTLALGLPVEDEPLRLLWAMTLGWKTAFTGDIDEPFLRAGTMHLFAIDGLRIALVSGIIVTLLRVLRLSRAWCGLVAIPVIWFYTAATGWESSAVRASVMMTIVLGGWALKRPGDLQNSLAAAAFIILLLDPRQMLEASFQLSFFVMLVIALMLPPLNALCDSAIARWLGPDPLLPQGLVPWWRTKLVDWSRGFAHFCMLSFAAWMGSLPLAAKYFHLFSPVSTPANVVAVPLGTFALMANLGALICGHWLPVLTGLLNHAAWFFMVAMTWVSEQFAKLPGAYAYVPEPSWTTITLYYVAVVAAFSGWFKTARRIALGVTLLAVIGTGYFWQWEQSRAETDITVLPLAGGHAVYVDADGRSRDWLVNCGNSNAVHYVLKDFLRGQGVNTLPRLVLADGNARNCSGAPLLDSLFGVGELWTGGVKFRSAAYRDAVAHFENTGRPPHVFTSGGTNGCWQVLYPPATGNMARADDGALVVRGNFNGARILLLSELSRSAQSELLSRTNDLRADIVVAGLPEKNEPLCDDLIAAIQPKLIVIADAEFPASRRASRALHERLAQTKIPVIYTRTAGAVRIIVDQSGWRLNGNARPETPTGE